MKSTELNSTSRLQSVDSFRVIAMFFVVVIHTAPFRNVNPIHEELFSAGVIANVIARFAVPFFFVISGYFWGQKIANGAPVWPTSSKMIRKLAAIYVAFCVLYLMPTQLISIYRSGLAGPIDARRHVLHEIAKQPMINWPFIGTDAHLWFLPALMCAIVISSFFVAIKKDKVLIIVSLGLYVFALLAKPYADTPLGISIDFNTRNGPFFALIFYVCGYLLSKGRPDSDWLWKGCVVMALGYLMQFVELSFLQTTYNLSPIQDYVFGTLLLGLGAALISLSDAPLLRNKITSHIGRFTLGIYGIHLIFAENLWGLRSINPMMDALMVLLVFVLSVGTTLILAKNKILARFLR